MAIIFRFHTGLVSLVERHRNRVRRGGSLNEVGFVLFEKLVALVESSHGMTLRFEHPGEVHFDDFDWKRRPSKRRNHNKFNTDRRCDIVKHFVMDK